MFVLFMLVSLHYKAKVIPVNKEHISVPKNDAYPVPRRLDNTHWTLDGYWRVLWMSVTRHYPFRGLLCSLDQCKTCVMSNMSFPWQRVSHIVTTDKCSENNVRRIDIQVNQPSAATAPNLPATAPLRKSPWYR